MKKLNSSKKQQKLERKDYSDILLYKIKSLSIDWLEYTRK